MKPLVLIPSGDSDADFTYASGFPVETGLYIRFDEADDVLVASPLEIDRARGQSKAARKLGFAEAGFVDHGEYASWPRLAARMLREKGLEEARGSPRTDSSPAPSAFTRTTRSTSRILTRRSIRSRRFPRDRKRLT